MRQKLTLLLSALLCAAEALAETYTLFNQGVGTFYDYFGTRSADKMSWVSGSNSGIAGFTISLTGSNVTLDKAANWALVVHSSAAETPYDMKLTAPEGYNITGYELTAQIWSASAPNSYVLTAADGTTQTINSTTLKTLSVSGLNASSTDISIVAAAASSTNLRWLTMKTLTVTLEPTFEHINVTYEQYVNGTATGVTFTDAAQPGSAVSIPGIITSGYNSIAYDITTEGTIGNEDTTIKVFITAKPGLVEAPSDLSNAKAYTIRCERGYYTTSGGQLANTVKSSYAVNNFAIISYEGKHFLWSVADGKFVACDGASLGNVPVAVTMTKVQNGLFKFQGGGKTMNATSGQPTGAVFDSWATTDAGNSCAVIEAADFDASAVLATLEAYYHPALDVVLNFAVNVSGTTEAENTRLGKITMTLNGQANSKFLYADTKAEQLEGFAAVNFTATATSYRGYEFTGFSVGDTDYGTDIEAGELADVPTGSTLTANYSASTGGGINLWDDYTDDLGAAYRIPAIVRTQSGRLIAFADYRPGHTDVGGGACSIERRYSDDGGKTWSPALRVAQGKWGENASNVIGWSFGDAAVVADNTPGNSGKDVLMISCGGNRFWTSSVYNPDVSQPQLGIVRWRSADGGETWTDYEYIMPAIMQAFVDAGLRAADGSSGIVRAFFTSGNITQSVRKAEGAKYNRIYCAIDVPNQNVVMYSDDFGETWTVLGGQIANDGDEAHVVELPDGDLLLVGRGNSSRWVNVFNYTDFSAAAGQWNATGQWNNAVATGCNGDVEVIEAYDAYGDKHTVVIQSGPMYSGQRRDIQYYYIALPKATGFAVTDFSTAGGASWTQGMNVTHNWSAYSSLLNNGDGSLDILFEESAKNETVSPSGYCIVYQQAHDIKDITGGQYFSTKEQAAAEGVRTPRPGHFYRLKGATSQTYIYNDGSQSTAYNQNKLPMKPEADAATIFYYDSQRHLVSYTDGRYMNFASMAPAATVGHTYTFSPTESGHYTIKPSGRDSYFYDYYANNGHVDFWSVLSSAGTRCDWEIEEVTTLPVTVSELGLTTLYSPVSLTIPEGAKAYAATTDKAIASIRFDEVEAVRAGTGVLIKAEPGNYSFTIGADGADYESDLKGSPATIAKSSTAANVYTLQDGPAFKLFDGETLTGFRSHIEAEPEAGIEAFDIIFGHDATGIDSPVSFPEDSSLLQQGTGQAYNLAGQRLQKPLKGVSIVGGRKILR